MRLPIAPAPTNPSFTLSAVNGFMSSPRLPAMDEVHKSAEMPVLTAKDKMLSRSAASTSHVAVVFFAEANNLRRIGVHFELHETFFAGRRAVSPRPMLLASARKPLQRNPNVRQQVTMFGFFPRRKRLRSPSRRNRRHPLDNTSRIDRHHRQ